MHTYERFGIGFISALLYPVLKCAQSDLALGSASSYLGAVLPFIVIGILVGSYAALVEKSESDRGKLFRICMALPAFVLGLASSPSLVQEARAEGREISCSPISDFQRGWYDVIGAMTNVKRPRYYLLSTSVERDEYIFIGKQKYNIIAKLDSQSTKGLLYDVDKCQLITND